MCVAYNNEEHTTSLGTIYVITCARVHADRLSILKRADTYFEISARGSSFYTEIMGGLTTFLSASYILALNPLIVSSTGLSRNSIFYATALSSGIFTFLMGALVNVPLMLAPGELDFKALDLNCTTA